MEKKVVQKKKYWWLSEDGHLTPANPFPTGGGNAAGRSRDSEHHILPLSQDWSKGCAGPWGMTDCMAWSVSAWGRQKAKALLNCLCIKALLLFTSAEKDVTPVFLPKFEPGPLFFPLQSTQCFALWWHSMLLSVLKCYTAALPDRSHG